MKLELSAARTRFVVDETIEVSLRLHNDGAAPLSVPDPFLNAAWQPTYVITGPAFPAGRRFSARSATSRDQRPAPTDVPLTRVELAPGATHEGELPLSLWCPITTPGAYTLVAELDALAGEPWPSARSQPLVLQLEGLAAQGVSVGVDVQRGPPADLHVSFVHAAEPPVLYDMLVTEDRPDLGELERASLEPRRTVAAGVGAVLVPWCSVDRMTAMAAWRAWLHEGAEGVARLYGDDSPLGEPVGLPVPAGTTLLPPAWQGPTEALDVLVLEPDRRRLGLACFTSQGPTAPLTGLVLSRSDARRPPTGALVWRSDAAGPLATARLALGPAALGSPRRAIAVATSGDDLVVSCYAVEPGGSGSPTATVTLPGMRAVPGSSVALRVTPAGHTRAWLLLDTKDTGWQVYLAHVEFDASGRLVGGVDRPTPLVSLGMPLVEAALELALPEAREPEELAWALRTDDRRVLWSRGGRAPRWYKAPRPSTLATPMQLRPLSQATYLATLQPGRAPRLITLEDEST